MRYFIGTPQDALKDNWGQFSSTIEQAKYRLHFDYPSPAILYTYDDSLNLIKAEDISAELEKEFNDYIDRLNEHLERMQQDTMKQMLYGVPVGELTIKTTDNTG